MLILGVILLVAGVAGLALSLFGADIDYSERSTELLSWNVAPATLVVWGAVSTLLVVLGIWAIKAGAQQGWRRRKEQKRLSELSEKLDRVEAERRAEAEREEG